jgi:3-deoxy-D-manno-octulosonate 8-phosphate phosphatase (KDO 8-P phosphatase)
MAINVRAKKIKLVICDVDGVLTDGKIIYDSLGNESKNFNVLDGLGLVLLKKCGIQTGIISARASKVVAHRAKDLQIEHVFTDAFPKLAAYDQLVKKLNVKDNEVCFIGDDLPDLAIMKRVGLAVAVSNAVTEVKRVAHDTTRKRGGEGAVREVAEKILKAQGFWPGILKEI